MTFPLAVGLFIGILFDLILILFYFDEDKPKRKNKEKKKKRDLPPIPVPEPVDSEYLVYEEKVLDAVRDLRERVQNDTEEYTRRTPSLYRFSNPPIIPQDNLDEWDDNPPDIFHIDDGEIPEGISAREWYERASNIIMGMAKEDLDV